MKGLDTRKVLLFQFLFYFSRTVLGETDSSDAGIIEDLYKGIESRELLKWPMDGNPCGPPSWSYIFCSGNRVTQIQIKNLGLSGVLPQNFNKLSQLSNLGLQHNKLNGDLPSFLGLSELQYAYLGNNNFSRIPSDFFRGLNKLQVLSLDYNPLNKSGWRIPSDLQNSAQLMNLSLIQTNLAGPLPEFLGEMSSLTALKLSYNNLNGKIPSSYKDAVFQILWLNNNGLTGSIDVVASMTSLKQLWLNSNQFNGTIPASLANCTSLFEAWLNNNQLVGKIPQTLTTMDLQVLRLEGNKLMGSIPKFNRDVNLTLEDNDFCQTDPGIPCSSEVTALLDFLEDVGYPMSLASSWMGNDPCGTWLGVQCKNGNVTIINLPNFNLRGTLSPALGRLGSLERIIFGGNSLSGSIPNDYTQLKSLQYLDLKDNSIVGLVPKFSSGVKLVLDGNQLSNDSGPSKSPSSSGSFSKQSPRSTPSASINSSSNGQSRHTSFPQSNGINKIWVIVPSVVVLFLIVASLCLWYVSRRKKANSSSDPFVVVHPRDPSDPDVKIVIANNTNRSPSMSRNGYASKEGSTGSHTQVFESGNLVISVQVLRKVTHNFAPQNELGRGGFGTVYKGEFEDGTFIAVKRMESCIVTNKALDEFQSEIAVLSKVRHRHLVSLLGYSVEGNERLLVYEYMPKGALSRHLFQWQTHELEPLSWKRRLNIALDVAKGMEYLHTLAQQSFIHRDLKSSNILLGDDFRAKVSDFGLVKLAPDGKQSVATKLAGTFGYLAPEYAVTGKVTTKADVFSYGVVLMELITGLAALDEERPEESRYLAEWFWRVKSNKEKLRSVVDKSLDVDKETFESITIVAELAGHCTARDPNQRPDMGHAVNVLAPLVDKWKPVYDEHEEYMGIDCSQPLCQMVKIWQAADTGGNTLSNINDSMGSIPPVPPGFADSFASTDAR